MKVFCSSCGSTVDRGDGYCQSCGAEQPVVDTQAVVQAASTRDSVDLQTPTQPATFTPLKMIAAGCAIGAAVAAWFGENAAIHAAGYSGFGGAGWITAIMVPLGAAGWVWDKLGGD